MMPAITTAATFVMSGPEENKDEPLYGRYGNPSRNSVEAIIASLEGAKHNALCFSSGKTKKRDIYVPKCRVDLSLILDFLLF